MTKINVLPPHLADLIAAGEVVERPASVIKELMENAIDAGASALTVEIKDGGMSYMRVTDNGSGIPPADAETAFLRHATSKLRDERGLEAIGTLGFRGEALAAIAAVSRIDMLTRTKGSDEGVSLSLEGGKKTKMSPAGCPEGTTIIVRDIFFNTPARLKFMKTDRAEGQAVSAAVLRSALSHPEVSVKYIKDGKEEAHTPGDGKAESAVYAMLGSEFTKGLVPVSAENVRGFAARPSAARGNRGFQFFFVNGRYVRSKTMQAALEQAYKNNISPGRFPACVLYLTVQNADVDVNVHPTKVEVKFLNEREIFDSIYYAVRGAIEPGEDAPERGEAHQTHQPQPRPGAFRQMSAEEYRKSGGGFRTSVPPMNTERERPSTVRERPVIEYQTRIQSMPAPAPAYAAAAPQKEESAPTEVRIIGEAMGTYIIAECGESLLVIDKHAAHERIIFDRIRKNDSQAMSERLLSPVSVHLGERANAVLENLDLLSELGFEVEDFGGETVLVRATPAECEPKDAAPMMEELAEHLSGAASAEQLGLRDKILQSVACKAAIKAGMKTDPRELLELAQRVAAGQVKYCPHGRPVAFSMTKKDLDKEFKRL